MTGGARKLSAVLQCKICRFMGQTSSSRFVCCTPPQSRHRTRSVLAQTLKRSVSTLGRRSAMHPVGDMGFPTNDCPGTFGDLPTYGPPRLLTDPKGAPPGLCRNILGADWKPIWDKPGREPPQASGPQIGRGPNVTGRSTESNHPTTQRWKLAPSYSRAQ